MTSLPAAPARNPLNIVTDESWVSDDSSPRKLEFFPTTLLWEPKLADRYDPRLSAVFSDADSIFGTKTVDPSIGLTVGLWRWAGERTGTDWQVDLFAVSHLRFSLTGQTPSIAQNYRWGMAQTFRNGNWVGKVAYEHTSTQLGDELFETGRRDRIRFGREELVAAVGYLWANQLRPYGQVGYAFSLPKVPEVRGPWRFDVGFDWYRRENSGRMGQPFGAINASFDPVVNYDVGMCYQVGWMWKKVDQRLGQLRLYAEFYDGFSRFGQLYNTRDRYVGFGIALDY